MDSRRVLLAVGVVLGLYLTYRGVSCALRTDRDRIREAVAMLTESFAAGDRRTILGLLGEGFTVTWRRRELDRAEVAQHLAVLFIRGERIVLAGGVRNIEIEPGGDRALVIWQGEAWRKEASSGRRLGTHHRGTGRLHFRKDGGSWLLAQAEAVDEPIDGVLDDRIDEE